jgi:L-amino acid N-acyltransferase YncA
VTGVVVRAAAAGDLPQILAIHNHHIANTLAIWRYEMADLAEREAWYRDRRANSYPVIVAALDGEVAGYGSYGPFRAGAGYHRTVENSIYVREDMQRRGVARALMLDLVDRATAQGRHVMVAGIGLPNDASVALHAALGFVDCGVIREIGWKFERWLDLRMMQKIL